MLLLSLGILNIIAGTWAIKEVHKTGELYTFLWFVGYMSFGVGLGSVFGVIIRQFI